MSYNVFDGTLNLIQPNITLTLTVTVTVHFYCAFYDNSPTVHSTVSKRCMPTAELNKNVFIGDT